MTAVPHAIARRPLAHEVRHEAADFVGYVDAVHTLARRYAPNADAARLVLDYLRHFDYDSYQWRTLVGRVDDDFIDYVLRTGLPHIAWFRAPVFGSVIKVSHLAAATAGLYLHGRPDGLTTNRGDLAGWAGDWLNFYSEWLQAASDAALMRDDIPSTFQLGDLLDDADADLIAAQLRNWRSLPEVVEYLYLTSTHPRIEHFFTDRFGTPSAAQAIAFEALTHHEDVLLSLGRTSLMGPAVRPATTLPDDSLTNLTRAFADRLTDLIDLESALIV
ncbi:hypothetical protein [Kribbella sp. NPDC051770]|uniref:hypothetical protein n=1 Tax=Kribbella sp. NPDC051770 TaxID=3155413 RepID=UPI0034230B96